MRVQDLVDQRETMSNGQTAGVGAVRAGEKESAHARERNERETREKRRVVLG